MATRPHDDGEEPRVELHGRSCVCGGGSWMLLPGANRARCAKGNEPALGGVVVTMSQWREAGKPQTMEDYATIAERRRQTGDRREFPRCAAALEVRLTRTGTWKDTSAQTEDTVTEVIAAGGALVRTRMALVTGETLRFEVVPFYTTRAQVLYVKPTGGPDGSQRVGLRFLDAPLPANLVPFDAEPLA